MRFVERLRFEFFVVDVVAYTIVVEFRVWFHRLILARTLFIGAAALKFYIAPVPAVNESEDPKNKEEAQKIPNHGGKDKPSNKDCANEALTSNQSDLFQVHSAAFKAAFSPATSSFAAVAARLQLTKIVTERNKQVSRFALAITRLGKGWPH